MPEFNVGDRVWCTTKVDNVYPTLDKIGTIIHIRSNGLHGVEFDQNVSGHNCGRRGVHGRCLWVWPEFLSIVDTSTPKKVKYGLSRFLEEHS